jgi:hypothetical protein
VLAVIGELREIMVCFGLNKGFGPCPGFETLSSKKNMKIQETMHFELQGEIGGCSTSWIWSMRQKQRVRIRDRRHVVGPNALL